MKKASVIPAVILLAGMLSFVACKKDQHTLSASATSLSFTADDEEEKSVDVLSNTTWIPQASDSWVTHRISEEKLYVKVQSHTDTGSSRTATITISAGNADPVNITIQQSARDGLSVSPGSLTFAANETAGKTVAVTTNAASWDATTTASWLKLSESGSSLIVTPAGSNSSSTARSADITLTAGNAVPVTVTVTQEGIDFPFVASNYSATGTPLLYFDTPGWNYDYWTGMIVPAESGKFCAATNFGRRDITFHIDYKDEKLTLDTYTVVASDATYYGYMCVGTYDSYYKKMTYYPNMTLTIPYNASTKTLNLSGTYNGLPIFVGILLVNRSTGYSNTSRHFANAYTNLKIVLTNTIAASGPGSPGFVHPETRGAYNNGGVMAAEAPEGYTIEADYTVTGSITAE